MKRLFLLWIESGFFTLKMLNGSTVRRFLWCLRKHFHFCQLFNQTSFYVLTERCFVTNTWLWSYIWDFFTVAANRNYGLILMPFLLLTYSPNCHLDQRSDIEHLGYVPELLFQVSIVIAFGCEMGHLKYSSTSVVWGVSDISICRLIYKKHNTWRLLENVTLFHNTGSH